jgi:hypothetical protein
LTSLHRKTPKGSPKGDQVKQSSKPGLTSLRQLLCMLAFLCTATLVRAQTLQTPDWQTSQPGATGVAMTLDSMGSPWVLGLVSPNSVDPGVGTLVLSRYTPGGTLQWTRTWFPTGYAGARPATVVSDSAGNAYAIGAYSDYNYTFTALADGSTNATSSAIFDAGWLVNKYGADGTLLWTRKAARVGGGAVAAVADSAGDLYLLYGASGNRIFTTEKLSGATGATLWSANSPAISGGEMPGELRLTADGQVVAAGAGGLGLALYAYATDTGAATWSTRLPEAAGVYAPGLALGPLGELVVTGSAGSTSLYLASIDANRLLKFSRSVSQASRGLRVAVDGQGRIFVAGVGSQPTNWVLLVVDASGKTLGGPTLIDRHATANETPRALVLHPGGAFTVTGDAGPGTIADPSATRATTARLNLDGSLSWLTSAPEARSGVAIEAASDGSVYVLGDTAQMLLHYPALAGPAPVSLTFAKTTVTGGRSTTGTVALSSSAGATVTLSSSNPDLVKVPGTVTAAAGSTTVSFSISTQRVRTQTAVTITAAANGRSVSSVLTLAPR